MLRSTQMFFLFLFGLFLSFSPMASGQYFDCINVQCKLKGVPVLKMELVGFRNNRPLFVLKVKSERVYDDIWGQLEYLNINPEIYSNILSFHRPSLVVTEFGMRGETEAKLDFWRFHSVVSQYEEIEFFKQADGSWKLSLGTFGFVTSHTIRMFEAANWIFHDCSR